MAGRVRGHPGGIFALLDLYEQGHWAALEADLMAAGHQIHHMGAGALSWHAVFVFARRALETPGSALAVSVHGPGARWSATEQLINGVYNHLAWLAWSKSKDASRPGAKPPAVVHLPGLEPENKDAKHYGQPAPLESVLEMLGEQAQEKFGDLVGAS